MKINFKGIVLSSLIAILAFGFLFNPNFAFADDGNLCEVSADVILVLDVSGSMEDGGSQSKCEWSEIKPYGGGFTWYLNTKYDVSETWCSGIKDSSDTSVPSFSFSPVTYTPEVLSKIESAKNAGKSFLDNLKSQDQSGLVSFSDTANLEKGLSNDHNATKTAVDAVVTGGATNIGDAIAFATAEFNGNANPQATKTIILLTDGKANKPNGSGSGEDPLDVAYAIEKATEAENLGYKVFTIGLGSDGDINAVMLQEIADITGATYHHAPNGDGLEDVYNEISTEICEYGSISGCKYNDLNNDGIIGAEEPKLPGWDIMLEGAVSLNQTTDENGCYTFAGLLGGDYTVSEGTNSSFLPFEQTYPIEDFYNITLSKGENLTDYDFLNYLPVEPEPGEIQPGDIVINEIMQNPEAASDITGEWFEVYNTTDNPVDLDNCIIRDDGSNSYTITSLSVPAHGYSVLARSANLALNGGIMPDYVYSSFSLGNTDDEIILECGSVEIDRVDYDGGPLFPDPSGASMVLNSPSSDNNVGENWCTSTTPYGAGDLGTPGTLNDICGGEEEIFYEITASAGENGSISPLGLVQVVSGASQAFSINPSYGYEISDVLVDSISVGALSSYTFDNVTSNHEILASFSELVFSPPTADPPAGTYSSTQNVTLSASGADSIHYATDGADPTCSTANIFSDPIAVASDLTLKTIACYGENSSSIATFDYVIEGEGPISYTITVTAGPGGSIAPSGNISVEEGSDQMFDIAVSPDFGILDILVDGSSVGAVGTYTFYDVSADHTISATFYQLPTGGGGGGGGGSDFPTFMITSSTGLNGAIDPLGAVSVNYGYSKQYIMTPDSGYEVEDVLIDGVSVGALTSYTFGNVISDHTISASFKASGEVAGASTEALYVFDEQTGSPLETSVVLTWKTNLPATTRVVYDTVSHPELGEAQNYGYTFSTSEDSEKVEYHVLAIFGLEPGTTYYWRAVSHGSGEVLGDELSFKTEESYTGLGGPLPPPPAEGMGKTATVLGETTEEELTSEVTEGGAEIFEPEQQEVAEAFLAALPFERFLNWLKNYCWLAWLILLIIIIYLLYKAYKKYLENKNKS
ncbi:MAG: VWA domain-containing protein [Candidatus Staskawiczbacteria bacterium]|nr:VWA domain-containing protein [Candidatus Staskawiczbacteria bacterium]